MPRQLLAAYPPSGPHFDEMLEAPFRPCAHWQRLFDHLVRTPSPRMRSTLQSVERQVYENGITYNVYADPQGAERPWELGVLPFILSPEEWAGIEAAIIQRATLLNHILADLYGPQSLLREGRLPPALIHGHAGFLRAAHGGPPQLPRFESQHYLGARMHRGLSLRLRQPHRHTRQRNPVPWHVDPQRRSLEPDDLPDPQLRTGRPYYQLRTTRLRR